jgi:hypothetical protein
MIKKLLHRVFGLCKPKEMSPMHFELDSDGNHVFYKRMFCKECGISIFERIKD